MRYQIGTSPAQRMEAMRAARSRPAPQASVAIQTVDGLSGHGRGHAPCGSCAGRGPARPLGGLGETTEEQKLKAGLAAVRDGLIVAGGVGLAFLLFKSFARK